MLKELITDSAATLFLLGAFMIIINVLPTRSVLAFVHIGSRALGKA